MYPIVLCLAKMVLQYYLHCYNLVPMSAQSRSRVGSRYITQSAWSRSERGAARHGNRQSWRRRDDLQSALLRHISITDDDVDDLTLNPTYVHGNRN